MTLDTTPQISGVTNPDKVAADGDVVTVSYTIVNPVSGKSISAVSSESWVSDFDYSVDGEVSFTVAENSGDERSATVTLSYEGADDVDFTVTQAAAGASTDYSIIYTSNVTFKTVTNSYAEKVVINSTNYDALRVSTSKAAGSGTFNVPAGTTKLHIHLAGWKGNTTAPSITTDVGTISNVPDSITADSGISNSSPYTLDGTASDYYYCLTLSNVTSQATITVKGGSGKRAVLFGVNCE